MLFLMLASALAAPHAHEHPAQGRVAADLQAGLIDETDALWISYLRHFEPEQVPERYAVDPQGWSCGTGVVMELRENWSAFTPDERARMTSVLAPWKQDLLEPAAPPPPPGPTSTCFGSQGANQYASEHFMIEWDNGITRNQAIQFAEALETSYDIEIDRDGWRVPDGMNSYLMTVFVTDQNYAGAYTTVQQCGSVLMPYIVAGRGSFYGGTWFMDMAAHEFNHAVQFGYGFGHQFWFWEATATYIEESVYPEHDGWAPYVEGYTAQPQISMQASSQEDQDIFNHMYGLAVWNFYLDEHVGGPELIREMWEYSTDNGEQYDLWMDDVLGDLGHDFEEVYKGFIANNTVMDFADQAAFPRVRTADVVRSLPADGTVDGDLAPESRGQAYLRFETDLADEERPDLRVTVEGDPDADYAVLLVGTQDGAVAEMVELEVTEGAAKGRLERLADFDEVWLVVSPLTRTEGEYPFAWTAQPVEARKGKLLGCDVSGGAGAAGWLAALPLLLAFRRRRLS